MRLDQAGFIDDHFFNINIYFCAQINSNALVSIMKINLISHPSTDLSGY